MIPARVPSAASGSSSARDTAASWYLVFVLTLAYTASFIDRQVLNLLVGPIKAEFGLSDTQLSLLQGLAFTISYVVMSPVFGRWADVGNRRNILTFGVALWSVGTMCCGFARSFWQLFAARFAVGGAEACLTPSAWSIIADSFPPERVPRAFSIYMIGPYLGGGLALIFGGILLEAAQGWDLSGVAVLGTLKPWQLVFVMVGLPGLLVALLLRFAYEPARQQSQAEATAGRIGWVELRQGFADRGRFYWPFYVGMALVVVALYGFPAWMPAVLQRQFGVSVGRAGIDYGVLVLAGGTVGVLSGPAIASWLTRRGIKGALILVPCWCSALLVPTAAALFFVTSYSAALVVGGIAAVLYSIPQALASSALQLATPNRMRGMASALYVFAVSLSGLALAPTMIALVTDYVFVDEARVGQSLAVTVMAACSVSTLCLWRAARAYRLLPR